MLNAWSALLRIGASIWQVTSPVECPTSFQSSRMSRASTTFSITGPGRRTERKVRNEWPNNNRVEDTMPINPLCYLPGEERLTQTDGPKLITSGGGC